MIGIRRFTMSSLYVAKAQVVLCDAWRPVLLPVLRNRCRCDGSAELLYLW
jgi:hypothetical protein